MKQRKLKNLADGERFRLSLKSTAAIYEVQTKKGGKVIFTSLGSSKTFIRLGSTIVYTC